MLIQKITMTGADESIRPELLALLSQQHPIVEWGILISNNNRGSNRFPKGEWINELLDYKSVMGNKLQLSAHLCGRIVREILIGIEPDFYFDITAFDRIQFNFHGLDHECHTTELPSILMNINRKYKKPFREFQFIFQIDGVNNHLFDSLIGFKGALDLVPLFDLSGGAGITPEKWPLPIKDRLCGYAGGLSPDNLLPELSKIQKSIHSIDLFQKIWIDAETHLRSKNDYLFDIRKAAKFVDIALLFFDQHKNEYVDIHNDYIKLP